MHTLPACVLAMPLIDRVHFMTMEHRLAETHYAVEADSYASLSLWRDYALEAKGQWGAPHSMDEHRVKWKQVGDGWGPKIGEVAKRPICISLLWTVIEENYLVLFWYGQSQLQDYKMYEEYLKKMAPQLYPSDENKRYRTADASNFAHCLHHVRDLIAGKDV